MKEGALVVLDAVRRGAAVVVGLPPPAVSWGGILSAAPAYIEEAWWIALFPGLALFATVSAYNLLAEGLRQVTTAAK